MLQGMSALFVMSNGSFHVTWHCKFLRCCNELTSRRAMCSTEIQIREGEVSHGTVATVETTEIHHLGGTFLQYRPTFYLLQTSDRSLRCRCLWCSPPNSFRCRPFCPQNYCKTHAVAKLGSHSTCMQCNINKKPTQMHWWGLYAITAAIVDAEWQIFARTSQNYLPVVNPLNSP